MTEPVRPRLGLALALLALCSGLCCAERGDKKVKELLVHELNSLSGLEAHATKAQIIEGPVGKVLELDGMVLVEGLEIEDFGIEVEILAPAPCYPGILFRLTDLQNFELAYAVPAVSGQSDAIQYDPIFNGSNTWQLHTGAAYQCRATVPQGEWFTLRIDVEGERAAIQVGDQPPLVVERLSHASAPGRIGLWTFRPARFRNMRVTEPRSLKSLSGVIPTPPAGAIDEWWLQGTGTVTTEPNGVLNLNRYLVASDAEARLSRRFTSDFETDVEIALGLSDDLVLSLDGAPLFTATHIFSGFEDQGARGWVLPPVSSLSRRVDPGQHRLEAALRATEPFGWGLTVVLAGQGIHLLPAEEGK